MPDILILYLLATGEPDAVFIGERAAIMVACAEMAATYEVDVSCERPSSENMPYLGLKIETSPRPKPRPQPEGL